MKAQFPPPCDMTVVTGAREEGIRIGEICDNVATKVFCGMWICDSCHLDLTTGIGNVQPPLVYGQARIDALARVYAAHKAQTKTP